MKSYSAATGVGKLIALIGWLTVGVGGILLIVSLSTMRSGLGLFGLLPAIGIAIGGLLLVCQGQLIQAVVDTARNTAELTDLLRTSQWEKGSAPTVSGEQSLPVSIIPPTTDVAKQFTYRTTEARQPSAPAISEEEKKQIADARNNLDAQAAKNDYRGHVIVTITNGRTSYRSAGSHFDTIEQAADFIDIMLQTTRG